MLLHTNAGCFQHSVSVALRRQRRHIARAGGNRNPNHNIEGRREWNVPRRCHPMNRPKLARNLGRQRPRNPELESREGIKDLAIDRER